jgi:hypothetical protein
VHCAETAQLEPGIGCGTHAPFGSQTFAPAHVSGSGAFFTGMHAPEPGLHVMHVPPQLPEQHVPSSHTPDAHATPVEQLVPAAPTATHAPLPSQ